MSVYVEKQRNNFPANISEEERQCLLARLLHQIPFTNANIWLVIAGEVSLSKEQHYMTEAARSEIVKAYKTSFPTEGNLPVSTLTQQAGITNLGRNRFLQRVCFNYNYELGGEERREAAWQNMQQIIKEKGSFDLNDPHHWTLERWVDYDFYNLRQHRFLTTEDIPSPVKFKLVGEHQNNLVNALLLAAILVPGGLFGIAGMTTDTMGWEHKAFLEGHFGSQVFPLLRENELVKAQSSAHRWGWDNPKIVKSDS